LQLSINGQIGLGKPTAKKKKKKARNAATSSNLSEVSKTREKTTKEGEIDFKGTILGEGRPPS